MPKDHSKTVTTKKQSIPNSRTDLLKQVLIFVIKLYLDVWKNFEK